MRVVFLYIWLRIKPHLPSPLKGEEQGEGEN